MSDHDLNIIVLETFAEFAQQVEQYKSGQRKGSSSLLVKLWQKPREKHLPSSKSVQQSLLRLFNKAFSTE